MPSKKRSRLAASSRQLGDSKSSRGVGKRTRAEDQNRNIQTSSKGKVSESHEETDILLCDGSRLKRKRLSEPLRRLPKEADGEADMRENSISMSTSIHSVATRCEQLIEFIRKNRSIMRPKLDLINDIVVILQKASAIKVLASVPNLPKILFIATQIGVEEEKEFNCATKALVEALIHLAKIRTEDLPDFSTKKRRVRSAFVNDAYVDYTEMQIEAAKKAAQWALDLLSNCVRGTSDVIEGNQHDNYRNHLQHVDKSELFVLPRDKLDPIVAGRLIEISGLNLQHAAFLKQYPAERPGSSMVSDEQLRVILSNPSCSSLLDQLLLNAEKTYTSCFKRSSAMEPLEFIYKVGHGVIHAGEQTFLALSPSSQMILLRRSKELLAWHRRTVERALLSTDMLSASIDTRSICAPISSLISYDVAQHWDLMDEVRREISRESEPFNLLSWRQRPFFRAVFSEALCLIRSETVSKHFAQLSLSSLVPLSRRFPTSLRSVVGFLATADKCFVLFENAPEDALETAVLSLKILQRFLRGSSGGYRISASKQAFLLCVESILERMSWTCAIGVARAVSHGTKSENEWKQIIDDMAVVICSIEVFRLPGGESAETEKAIDNRVLGVGSFLFDVLVHKCVSLLRKPGRPRVNGLLAFWLTGLVFARGLSDFAEAVKVMDQDEVLELLRSLHIVSSWGSSESGRERCNVVLRILKRRIRNQ